MPRLNPDGGKPASGADLPYPLAPSDAVRLKRVFALQAAGAMAEASAILAGVDDAVLNGHVQAQRILANPAAVPANELAEWLAHYADQPDAPAIHALLLARLPGDQPAPPAPAVSFLQPDKGIVPAPEESEPPQTRLQRNPLLDRTLRERAHAGQADSALRLLAQTRGLDALYGNQLRAELAQLLFTQGRDRDAFRIAGEAVKRSGGRVGLAGYVAGLAAWRMGRTDLAQPLFEGAFAAELAPPALRAGAAFWAARSHLRNGDAVGYAPWMHRAADNRRTFYGLLARRALGLPTALSLTRETLGAADTDLVMATPAGRRAFALLQVGQPRRAEAELRTLWSRAAETSGLGGAILRVAQTAGMVEFASQIAGLMELSDGRGYDDARFPLPPLRPAGGFRMDPALVYALTRLESNFDPTAISGAGARGLMQVMPVTASFLDSAGRSAESYERRLHDPATNLSVGQSYVIYLSRMEGVQGDLIRLLGSYNAGPTSFARMVAAQPPPDDPLLFVESIPNDETRGFVPRALTYCWIYADRLHLPAPSLDELAAGAWPTFRAAPLRREAVPRLH